MKTTEAKSGLLLLVAMTIVNLINYGINLILGRFLGPELFAEFHIVATLVLVLAFMGVAIQMTAAKITASDHQRHFLRWLDKNVRGIAIVTAVLFMLTGPIMASFFKFSSVWPFIILSIGIPVYFGLCFYRGILQGRQEFSAFAYTFIIETCLRLVATIAVIVFIGSNTLIISALALSFLISFLGAAFYARYKGAFIKSQQVTNKDNLTPVLWFVAFMGLYELSQIIISHSDVFLTKHFMSEFEAGQYASISLIGRMIYYGTWTFVMLLFPKVIEAKNKGKDPSPLLMIVSALVIFIGVSAVMFSYFWGDLLVNILFGSEFLASAKYLYPYAIATTLFALSNVIVYYYLSLEKYIPVWLSLFFGCAQIITIWNFHHSIQEIITVQIILMSGLLIMLISYHVFMQYINSSSRKSTSLNPNLIK